MLDQAGGAADAAYRDAVAKVEALRSLRRGLEGEAKTLREGVIRDLAIARERSQAEVEALRAQANKLIGAEDFTGGRTRIPDVPVRGKPIATRVAGFRGGEPRKPPSLTHGYTGYLRRTGNYRTDTTRLVGESALEAQRYASVKRLQQTVTKAGKTARPADTLLTEWVPVRTRALTENEAAQLRQALSHIEESDGVFSRTERRQVGDAYRSFVKESFPDREQYAHVREGQEVGGVVWVPKKLLDGVNRPNQRALVAGSLAVVDTVQNLVKAGILFAKPAYVVANVAGNVLFNLVQQGVMTPVNWTAAARLGRRTDLAAAVDELMGSGLSRSLAQGTPGGPLGHAVEKVGDTLNTVTDQLFRRAAFLHEARRYGFGADDRLRQLIFDPERRGALSEIVGRATAEIVDYDRLGPLERDVVRRAVFVYPWVKGATVYGGHFLAEHPVQAAAYSQAANVGKEQAQQDLGDVPSYARGTFKVGGSTERPLVVNPAGISPFSQAAQVGYTLRKTLTGEGGKSDLPFGLVSPLLAAGVEAGSGRDLFTGATIGEPPAKAFAGRLLADTAPALLIDQLARAGQSQTERRAFPATEGQVLERFAIGSSAPRTANVDVLNAQAEAEATAHLTSPQRARRKVFRRRAEVLEGIKAEFPDELDNGRLPKVLRVAYNREAMVAGVRAQARKDHYSGVEYQRAALTAELRLLGSWKLAEQKELAELTDWAKTARADQLEKARRRLQDHVLDGAYRAPIRNVENYMRERGYISGD